ncbi:bile acid-inducible operon protein F [gamma proteobacterium HTCC5015]|nr:bile acid-inducible operon protein F [gamma proteobacterium HTCC5015]
MKGALEGVLVVDLSQNLPGPYCSRLLADQGARVIKVEPKGKGDFARLLPGFYKALNGGKESLSLDLKDPSDREVLYQLAQKADVVIESFRPGVVKRLEIDYERLKRGNPRLVYCSISGYGQEGAIASVPAHDINLQANAGLIGFSGRRYKNSDEECPIPIADMVTSLYAHSAIVSQLLARGKRRKGAYIDMSMNDGLEHMVSVWEHTTPRTEMVMKLLGKRGVPKSLLSPMRRPIGRIVRRGLLPAMPHYGVFECRDGQSLCLGIVDENHFWKKLCEELGGPMLRFSHMKPPQRVAMGLVIKPLLARALKAKTAEQWYRRLAEELALPVSLVRDSGDLERVKIPAQSPLGQGDKLAEPRALGADNGALISEFCSES